MKQADLTLIPEWNEPSKADLSEAARIRYLTPHNSRFARTAGHMLAVHVDDVEHQAVYLHCSFPHTNNRSYVSVRTGDNKEIGMIRVLDDFPADTVSLLEEQIRIRYFAPAITKVIRIHEEFGYSYWETETEAGSRRFTVRSSGGNVKLVSDRKVLISDVDGNRFVIENLESLSEKEYRMVEMCL